MIPSVNGGSNGTPASNAPKNTSSPKLPGAAGLAKSNIGGPHAVNIPGKYSEQLGFAPSELLRKDQLKKPIPEIVREINKRSKATLEMSHGRDGLVVFAARGPVEDVRQALRDVAREVGSKVCSEPYLWCSSNPNIPRSKV